MKKNAGILAVIGAAIAVLILAGTAFAQDGGVSVSDGAAEDGGSADVSVDATGVGDPGLGAWTIDVSFDNSLLTATDCGAEQGGVCNENFSDSSVRVTGASAGGLEGDTNLGSITFECDGEGESDLTITLSVFADATIGNPQDLDPSISNGTFTCGEVVVVCASDEVLVNGVCVKDVGKPGTGFTSSSSSLSWFIALFAVIGVLGLAASYGVVRLRQ